MTLPCNKSRSKPIEITINERKRKKKKEKDLKWHVHSLNFVLFVLLPLYKKIFFGAPNLYLLRTLEFFDSTVTIYVIYGLDMSDPRDCSGFDTFFVMIQSESIEMVE